VKRGLLAASTALALAGCGTPSADLFIVNRTGSLPGARLTLRFDDGGQVRCNGGAKRAVTSADLIDARDINRVLADAAKDHLTLAARPGSTLQFRVLLEDGTVRFADNSRPPVKYAKDIAKLQVLSRRVAKRVCGLPR
jgi:hypothetical protein